MATAITETPYIMTFRPPESRVTYRAYVPNNEDLEKTCAVAKAIFAEAFETTYTQYHKNSGSGLSVEKWLRLREGVTLRSWLEATFDEEYAEYKEGKKGFIYLLGEHDRLVGFLSHSPVSESGELYLSQCSLEAASRYQKVATTAFRHAFTAGTVKELFPGVKEVKLITRKINEAAKKLYTGVGFTRDETIDPVVYGESYDDRYVGYRLIL